MDCRRELNEEREGNVETRQLPREEPVSAHAIH
jgi:hypothetical protein